MIKAIIFDCFGVLVGTGYWNIYESLGGDLVSDRDFLDNILSQANSGSISSDDLHEATALRLGIPKQEWVEAIHADEQPNKDLFSYIKKELHKKYKLAILSNAGTGVIERKIPEDLLTLFDAVIVSGEVGFLKPNPAIFKLAAQNLRIDPGEAVFIDDHEEYLSGVDKIGMKRILFTSTKQLVAELDRLILR